MSDNSPKALESGTSDRKVITLEDMSTRLQAWQDAVRARNEAIEQWGRDQKLGALYAMGSGSPGRSDTPAEVVAAERRVEDAWLEYQDTKERYAAQSGAAHNRATRITALAIAFFSLCSVIVATLNYCARAK